MQSVETETVVNGSQKHLFLRGFLQFLKNISLVKRIHVHRMLTFFTLVDICRYFFYTFQIHRHIFPDNPKERKIVDVFIKKTLKQTTTILFATTVA